MIRKTVSMPDEMGEFIEARVRDGQFGNESEYIRHLIREEQGYLEAVAKMQALIDEGLASGISNRTVDEIWEEANRTAAKKRRRAG